jgi:hypothetical protein
MTRPFVSVLLVNYNGAHYLADCLTALAQQTYPAHAFEVIIVDNASSDASCALLRTHYPWVRVVASATNTGFAGGNNRALTHAHGEWIVLLNTDTVAEPTWLAELVAAAQAYPHAAGIAAKLVFHTQPHIINSAGLLLLTDGRGADRGEGHADGPQFAHPQRVFGATGASVLLRRTWLDQVGLFDERLFLYYEDFELAHRIRRAGGHFWYAPRAVVRHIQSAATGAGSPRQVYHIERNRIWVNAKHGSLFIAWYTLIGSIGRMLRGWLRYIYQRQPTMRQTAWALTRAVVAGGWGVGAFWCERGSVTARASHARDI